MRRRSFPLWALLLFALTLGLAPAATITGLLVYAPAKGDDASQPQVTPFSEIIWQSPQGGSITTMTGAPLAFDNDAIARFVYLDENYWRTLSHNTNYTEARKGILSRELVIPADHLDLATDAQIAPYITGSQTLASIIKSAPQLSSALTPTQEILDGEIKHYQDGEKKVNGQWILKLAAKSSPTSATKTFDITTIDGKVYKNVSNVQVSQSQGTLSFLYENGGATVDLAFLDPETQKKFNYDPKAQADRRLAEEKAQADADDSAQSAALALQKKALYDVHAFTVAPSKSTLSGQVFVATKGGDNIKLGNIRVLLFAKSQVDLLITPKKLEAVKQLTAINDALKKANDAYIKADAASANGQSIVENGVYIDPEKRKSELQDQIRNLEVSQQTFVSPDYYFTDLPPPLAQVQTDAEGKFTMSVPLGEYVLAAKASRTILIVDEHYSWLVKFDMGEIARTIQLTNDNTSSSDSEDSMIVTQ